MALIQLRREQSEDSESRSLLSQEHSGETSQYDTFTGSTGSATELRFFILGSDEDLMDHTCDIILRERAKRAESETQHRKGQVCGRKISVVKSPSIRTNKVESCFGFSSLTLEVSTGIKDCASKVFPGPHAFLLVTDNREVTGRERYILKAIAEVFGKEALDYTIVLIIGRNEPKGISKNVRRVYTLEENERSVQSLFIETERMIQDKEFKFFIQPSYENLMKKAFLLWEKERDAEISNLRKDIADKEKQHVKEVTELKEHFRETENKLKKESDTLKRLMLDTLKRLKIKDRQHEVEPGVSGAHENPLMKDSDTNIFSSIVDEQDKNVETYRKMYSSMVDDYIRLQNKTEKLQKEVEQLKAKGSELEQKLMEAEERERQAIKQVEATLDRIHLDKLQGDLDRQEEHEEKTQHVTSGSEHELHSSIESTSPAVFEEDKERSLDEKEGEIKNRKEDSHKLVRRDSIEEPPDMSGSEHGPLRSLH